jgi:hypothetical protein
MRRSRRVSRKQKRRRRASGTRRRQRGGAVDLPSGYDYTMTVAYTPKSDKLGSPDEVPRVGGRAEFLRDVERG